ncbi:MAG: hypothetical protein LBS59_02100 [Puniceicoccales bacterium]|jgi:hypothetical protein|nr:hypothetical protein [Puniceicoccales bacterium]
MSSKEPKNNAEERGNKLNDPNTVIAFADDGDEASHQTPPTASESSENSEVPATPTPAVPPRASAVPAVHGGDFPLLFPISSCLWCTGGEQRE